ncbi:hypothetical protein GP486_001654 [Trichoglossum hirsutum]|uniref:LCCL domain-containing protein n=1 Tax=Trichoglossum hirsutum TaxID=265104 RepID=A0A9P8RSF7_9PEZI|nr:hypothetical protein GP486_001654 [Trichoglossum hirsutum]
MDLEGSNATHSIDGSSLLSPISRDGPSPPRRYNALLHHIKQVSTDIITWVKGPQPPQIQRINSFFPRIQTLPFRFLDRHLPKRKHKLGLLLGFYLAWLLTFVMLLVYPLGPYLVSVDLAHQVRASGNGCGLNGNNCRPFENSTFAFSCPANCQGAKVLNPYAVGSQEIIYQPLVVGGPQEGGVGLAEGPIYRGDSFLCAAALHAGVISNEKGGCGVVALVGQRDNFPSTFRNGVQSISFNSSFPLSFSFVSTPQSECNDLRWPLLAVSVIFTSILSVFTTSPAVFFSSLFTAIFFHVGLASDPPNLPSYYSITSVVVGRFLPAGFVAFVLYRYCVRPQLEGLVAQYEKTILWVGGCWVGALTNYTLDFIPIQRLTPHDLNQQPGAKAALSVIVIILTLIAVGQIYYLRLEGRLPGYLALYLLFGIGLAIFVAIPGLSLRIHHYILALLLLPGTAIQTRPSLLYQGILVGLFINGVARWGFDSILQTPAALLGDGQRNSVLPVVSLMQVSAANITFSWTPPLEPFDGLSVLVNDVERFRSYRGDDRDEFTWERPVDKNLPYYFRFGYVQGSSSADYTRAGIWKDDGSWTPMEDGPSKRLI